MKINIYIFLSDCALFMLVTYSIFTEMIFISTNMNSQRWWNFWYSVFSQNIHLLVFLGMHYCLWQLQTLWTPFQTQNIRFPHFLHLSVGWMQVIMKTYLNEEVTNMTLEVIATEWGQGTWWGYYQKGHMKGFWDAGDSLLIDLHVVLSCSTWLIIKKAQVKNHNFVSPYACLDGYY
jgi:hypothetical protein